MFTEAEIENARFKLRVMSAIHVPYPHVISLYGWNFSPTTCMGHVKGSSGSSFDGYQCQNTIKYIAFGYRFCTLHAKKISPDLSKFIKQETKIDPNGLKKISINQEKFLAEYKRLQEIIFSRQNS